MASNVLLPMATGGAARSCTRKAIRSISRTRDACLWPKTWVLDCHATTSNGANSYQHRVHGHWRKVFTNVMESSCSKLDRSKTYILHPHLHNYTIDSLPIAEFQLIERSVLTCSSYVICVSAFSLSICVTFGRMSFHAT